MRRYNKLLAGASWMAEYGDPDTDDWKNFLSVYSAYHNIHPTDAPTVYPHLLMMTSMKDDRVHPYHARSFVQRLIDLRNEGIELGLDVGDEKVYYYENVEGFYRYYHHYHYHLFIIISSSSSSHHHHYHHHHRHHHHHHHHCYYYRRSWWCCR